MTNRTRACLTVAIAAVLAWSVFANLVLGDAWYIGRNLALSAALLLVARRSGATTTELGLARADARSGLAWGGVAVAVVATAVLVAAALSDTVPALRVLLSDQRADLAPAALVFAVLVRIPLGTVLFEELLFRGVLLAALERHVRRWAAVVTSSVVFGLWHIAPTVVALRINEVAPASGAGIAAVLGAVAITTVGGLVFCSLRLRSGSLLAPMLAHWATNAFGLLLAAA